MTNEERAGNVPRWNMKAVISTVDIVRSDTGLYVKYDDLLAHDDAIRREAVSKAIEYIDSNHNDGLQWDRHDFDALRAAILATEPAREGE